MRTFSKDCKFGISETVSSSGKRFSANSFVSTEGYIVEAEDDDDENGELASGFV